MESMWDDYRLSDNGLAVGLSVPKTGGKTHHPINPHLNNYTEGFGDCGSKNKFGYLSIL